MLVLMSVRKHEGHFLTILADRDWLKDCLNFGTDKKDPFLLEPSVLVNAPKTLYVALDRLIKSEERTQLQAVATYLKTQGKLLAIEVYNRFIIVKSSTKLSEDDVRQICGNVGDSTSDLLFDMEGANQDTAINKLYGATYMPHSICEHLISWLSVPQLRMS